MNEWVFYILAACTGVFVKLVDQMEDVPPENERDKRMYGMLKYPLAIAYGLVIGYTLSFSTFSTLWLAVLAAQFITGKIDKPSHFMGFFISIAFAVVLGIGNLDFWDFFILMVAGAMDEMEFVAAVRDYRLVLKLATLAFGIFGRWEYFIAIIAFDLAYYATGKLFHNGKGKEGAAPAPPAAQPA